MKNDNKWLLMTYYCPTYGSVDRCEQIQLSKEELTQVKIKFSKRKN